jgi:hypothetical protein
MRRITNGRFFLPIFCLVVVVGGISLFAIASLGTGSNGRPMVSNQNVSGTALDTQAPSNRSESGGLQAIDGSALYKFGNYATNFTGWQMPANVLTSTSFVTTQDIYGGLQASFNFFPYQMGTNTTLYLGLYIDGQLKASRTVDISQTHARPASMVTQPINLPGGPIANFTHSIDSYSVPYTFSTPIGTNTVITLTAFATSPIWVQTATGGAGSLSYELSGITNPLPSSLPSDVLSPEVSGLQAASAPLNIGGYSVEH